MNNEEPSLGVVVAQLKFLSDQINELKNDVKDLQKFKWQMIGAGTLIGAVLAFFTKK